MKTKKFKFFFLILCLSQVFYIFNFRSGFKYDIINNPFNPDSGLAYAVDPEIIESKNLLKKNNTFDFKLSKSLQKNTYFYQRTIEFNYPIRMNNNSDFIFFHNPESPLLVSKNNIAEEIPENCKLIETGVYLKLAKC